MHNKVLISIVGSILLISVGIFIFMFFNKKLLNTPPQPVAIITRTKDGFSPDEISIKQGQTVEFKTNTNKLFWPASDLHPTHELYPEFDPKLPIKPDKSWSFTFDKKGIWRFHDHLAPYFTGTITVE